MAVAAVVGLAGCWYGIALLFKRAGPRRPLSAFRPETLGMIALLLYAAIQVLPLGLILPISVDLPDGSLSAARLSLTPGDSWLALVSFGSFGLFTLLVLQVASNRRRARLMLAGLFAIVVAHALFALINLHYLGDTVLGLPKSQYEGFATGTFVNRNSFATFAAAGLSLGVALLFDLVRRERERSEPSLWLVVPAVGIGLVFIASALLFSGSRMGAVAGAAGVALVTLLALVSAGERKRSTALVALGIGLALVGAVLAYGSGTLDRLALLDSTGEDRAELFSQVIAAIARRPLLGYGGGSFITAFPAFQHPPLSGELVWNKAHNTYLALWFEYGVIFGSIPILVVAALVARALSGLFSQSSRPLALAAAGVVLTFSVHAIVDFSLEIQGNVYLMLTVLALGAAHAQAPREPAVRK
jgi:O-antigen ligase